VAKTRRSGREKFLERQRNLHESLLGRGTDDHYEDTALYDYEYAERTDDVRWYRKLASAQLEEGDTILELGAGTGRITSPLARDGFEVVALDRKTDMLDALKSRIARHKHRDRIRPVEADMRELPLSNTSANMVIAPFNALMHLYTWQDLLACFREVYRVLKPRSLFAFDVQLPDLDWLNWDPEARHAVTRFVHPSTGEKLIYSTNHRYDPQTQVCHIRIYYDEAPPRGSKFRPPETPKRLVHLAHRQIFPEELRMLVETAGFDLLSLTGDFRDWPLREGCESQVALCSKPARRRKG
jgi:ubiquinone/menaquinone biosynthesis C-methylase UbiE